MIRQMDYARLKALLEEQETFPHDFTLKFIGVNSQAFAEDVKKFEARYPSLRKQAERKSSGEANIALTYLYLSQSADEIITLLQDVSKLRDVKVIL